MDATTRPYHDPQAELRALFAGLRASTTMDDTEWIETCIGAILARLGFDPETIPVQTILYDTDGAATRSMLQDDLALRDADIEML